MTDAGDYPPAISSDLPRFEGGAIDAPAYDENGVVAYSPEQAKKIFLHLTTATANGKYIPFLMLAERECAYRRDVALSHMLNHQHVDPRTLGTAVSRLNPLERGSKPVKNHMPNYSGHIADALSRKPYEESHDGMRPMDNFKFHTAPTILVRENGEVAPRVLDPALCDGPVSCEEWAGHQRSPSEIPAVPVCHRLFDGSKVEEVFGSFEAGEAEKYFKKAHTCAVYSDNALKNNSVALRNYDTNFALLQMAHSIRSQEQLNAQAVACGMAPLPNCGPQALAAAQSQAHPLNGNIPESSRLHESRLAVRPYAAEGHRSI